MLEWGQILKTILVLAIILGVLLTILVLVRRVMGGKGAFLGLARGRGFQVIERSSLDPRRDLLRVRDGRYEYTLLLGQTELLLDKCEVSLEGGITDNA